CRRVDDAIAVTGTQHGKVVDPCGGVREQVGNLDAGLTVLLEDALTAKQAGILLDELILRLAELCGTRLAVEVIQERLGVEGVEMTGSAGHEEENDSPGPGTGFVRRLRGERVGRGAAQVVLVEEGSQGQRPEATEGFAEEPAPCSSRLEGGRH